MIYKKQDGDYLLITRLETDAPIVKLLGDYRVMWERLETFKQGEDGALTKEPTPEMTTFVNFLNSHGLLPQGVLVEEALMILSGVESLQGEYVTIETEAPIEIVASIIFDAYGNRIGRTPDEVPCGDGRYPACQR
jgi:hypothetical protein